ncbi:MAG: ExbD/TolR family protein [bacterium]
MRRSALQRGQGMGGQGVEPVNVTPLIDVVMCMIIFFLIVGKLAAEDTGRVKLPPSAVGRGEKDPATVVVTVGPDPGGPVLWGGVPARVSVSGERATDSKDIERLIVEHGQAGLALAGVGGGDMTRVPVVIRADRRLPFSAVEPALAACAALGISKVQYGTERVP